ncbi:MAG TPA: hypothetical protein PKI46_03315 [Bacteroidales bacterium]|nr:hypothetical protein [Bacteroidales bacterium]
MAQEKIIRFASISTVKNIDGSLEVNTFTRDNYPEDTSSVNELENEPDVFRAELPDEVKFQDSIKAMEGELIISKDSKTTDLSIDINGDLLILHNKSSRFSINEMGELEYTFN